MLCGVIVANLRAGDNSVSVITLNPPYDLMADLTKVSLGRPKANTFKPSFRELLHSLRESWDANEYKEKTEPILASTDNDGSRYTDTSVSYVY